MCEIEYTEEIIKVRRTVRIRKKWLATRWRFASALAAQASFITLVSISLRGLTTIRSTRNPAPTAIPEMGLIS